MRAPLVARPFFQRYGNGKEFSCTKLMLGHSRCGRHREALRIYKEMREEGILPKSYTFVAALQACMSVADLDSGTQIHTHITESGEVSNVFVANTLVNLYLKCRRMNDARHVFDTMPHQDVVTWNVMIMGCAHMDAAQLALQLYTQMQHQGFIPDSRTLVAALKACASLSVQEQGTHIYSESFNLSLLEKGRALHSQVTKSGFQSDIFVATALLDMYAKCGSMVDAETVFEGMPSRNLVSWTTMIMGYAQLQKAELALHFYACMRHEGFSPDALAFVAALKACGSLAEQEESKQVHGATLKVRCLEMGRVMHWELAKSGFQSDIFVASTLIDTYARCGSMIDAHWVFEKMPSWNVVSWNALIMGYARMDKGDLALQLYAHMRHEGYIPDIYTFTAALMACGSLPSLEAGKEIHSEICKVGLEGNSFVATCLVDMYGKCGKMDTAQLLFHTSCQRNAVTWNAFIAGYSRQGYSQYVFKLFESMQLEGIKPISITFVSVLTVCNHAGLIDKGRHYFQCMLSKYGITASYEHYTCMIDLLGRAGKLEEAVDLIKKMPFQADITTWKAILGACRMWNNLEVGSHAFVCTVRLDEKQATTYVLMTNIYASASMLEKNMK